MRHNGTEPSCYLMQFAFYRMYITSVICCLLGEIAPTQYLKTKITFQEKTQGSINSILSEIEVLYRGWISRTQSFVYL